MKDVKIGSENLKQAFHEMAEQFRIEEQAIGWTGIPDPEAQPIRDFVGSVKPAPAPEAK